VADDVTFDSLLSKNKLLDPDGPVCLIVQATMGIAAGLDRFQPAGFPEIGHVIYDAPRTDKEGKLFIEKVCIVDSPASMANHLEQVCLAGENDPSLHDDLNSLPYVKCVTDQGPQAGEEPPGRLVTTTLTEGHRLASDYFLDGHRLGKDGKPVEATFRDELRTEFEVIEVKKDKTYFITPEAWWTIYQILFKYDPNSLVHGVLFAKEQIKVSRLLTAHLEALGASRVGRSGVKFDRLGKTTSGQPIFSVDEETAREIKATFIIDLAMLRSYGRKQGAGDSEKVLGLAPGQMKLLLALSLWKVRELLRRTFSYRSGCKLRMQSVTLRTDDQNDTESIATQLPVVDMAAAIRDASYPAEGPRVTAVYYPFGDLFKPSRDETPAAGGEDEAEAGDESEG
jgi:CRISPR-associated protein Csb1